MGFLLHAEGMRIAAKPMQVSRKTSFPATATRFELTRPLRREEYCNGNNHSKASMQRRTIKSSTIVSSVGLNSSPF
jgi:hypothetical protein